jgi:hypothetical protein
MYTCQRLSSALRLGCPCPGPVSAGRLSCTNVAQITTQALLRNLDLSHLQGCCGLGATGVGIGLDGALSAEGGA